MNFVKATALAGCVALTTGCVDKQTVTHVGDAENILFTTDGRLLVSGGKNIYQVTKSGDQYQKQALYTDRYGNEIKCNFTGIAQKDNWVFSSCVETKWLVFTNNHLLAADLTAEQLKFSRISPTKSDPYDSLFLPNGLAMSPTGDLLVADYNLFAASGIAKVTIDYSGSYPALSSVEKNVVGVNHGLSSPNGIRVTDDKLFVSDGNSVKRYQFDGAGNIPTHVEKNGLTETNETIVWKGGLATIVDDIMPYCGGVALTSYLGGKLIYVKQSIDEEGNETFVEYKDTGALAFNSPSALAIGQAPLFSGYQLLVTEKGLLQETGSSFGNRLSVMEMPFDLNSQNACNIVASVD
jgi:sugar lactone lactonase YvrE